MSSESQTRTKWKGSTSLQPLFCDLRMMFSLAELRAWTQKLLNLALRVKIQATFLVFWSSCTCLRLKGSNKNGHEASEKLFVTFNSTQILWRTAVICLQQCFDITFTKTSPTSDVCATADSSTQEFPQTIRGRSCFFSSRCFTSNE